MKRFLTIDKLKISESDLVSAFVAAGFDEVSSTVTVRHILTDVEKDVRTEQEAVSLIKQLTGLAVSVTSDVAEPKLPPFDFTRGKNDRIHSDN